MPEDAPNEAIGCALALLPSGCSILTCRTETDSTGLLASWVQQAAFEPPMVTVAVKKDRPVEALLQATGRFVLNMVGDDPSVLFKHFGKGFGPGEPAFAGLTVTETQHGVTLADAAGWLACEIRDTVTAGDHRIYVGQVVSGSASPAAKPYVHLRKTGFSY